MPFANPPKALGTTAFPGFFIFPTAIPAIVIPPSLTSRPQDGTISIDKKASPSWQILAKGPAGKRQVGGGMQVKKLEPQEYWQARLIDAVAFESPFDLEKEREKSRTEKAKDGESWWAAFDGDTPCACLAISQFQVSFDGHTLGLGGVGGVASLPASRRGGAVRACMQASLQDLYAQGHALSALYPFSTAYYEKFGYANGAECQLWHVPMGSLPVGDFGGRIRQLFPGDGLAPLLTVYNAFYKGCNLASRRETYDKELLEKDLLSEKRYIYLWQDEAGAPGAFCVVGRDGDELNARPDFGAHNALLFRDARSFQALTSFLRKAFSAYYKALRFSLPAWAAVAPLLSDCAPLKRECFYNGMLRAVNAEKLLSLCACKGTGALTLQIEDPLIPQNQDTFRLDFKEGAPNKVQRVQAPPDITLGPGRLAALLCGVHNARELSWMPDITIHDPAAPFSQVFYPKPCHLPELF